MNNAHARQGRGLAAALAFLLAACGGGGGDGGDGGNGRPDPVTYALSLTVSGNGKVTSPTGMLDCGSTCSANVPLNTEATLTAVPAGGHMLQTWGGACSGAASTCTVTMNAARSVTASFVAAGSSWQTTTDLSAAGASAPRVVMDDQGNGLAVWSQRDSGSLGNDSLWYSRYSATSGQWSSPALLENLAGNSSLLGPQAQLALHRASGRAVLVWTQTNAGRVDLWARDFDPTAGWGTAVNIEAQEGQVGVASAGIDAAGHAIVAWSQMTPRWSIWANRFVRGSGWGAPQLIESNDTVGGTDGDPAVAVAGNGQAVVAWVASGHGSAVNGIWTNRFVPGSGWGTAGRRVPSTQGFARSRPAIAADAQGRALLAWGQLDVEVSGAWNGIQTLRFDGSWASTPVAVGARQTVRSTVSHPVLTMNAAGTAAVAWGLPETARLLAAVAPAGGAWGAVATLNTGLSGSLDVLPAVALDDAGTAVVAWRQGSPDVGIQVQRRNAGTGQWQAETIATRVSISDGVWGFDQGLGLNGSGQALVGWSVLLAQGTVARVRRWGAAR